MCPRAPTGGLGGAQAWGRWCLSLGRHNKMPPMGQRTQHTFISHGLEAGKSEIKVPDNSAAVRTLLLAYRWRLLDRASHGAKRELWSQLFFLYSPESHREGPSLTSSPKPPSLLKAPPPNTSLRGLKLPQQTCEGMHSCPAECF